MTSISLKLQAKGQFDLSSAEKKGAPLTTKKRVDDAYILELLSEKSNYEKGFRLLLQQYQERLYLHIRRMVNSHEDANDVIQNCFIKIYRSIHKFEKKSKLYTWLYRIATNEALTFIEKRKKRGVDSLDSQDVNWHDRLKAEEYLNEDKAQFLLQKAIEILPAKQRAVFNMRYYEELSYRDISESLGTSQGALKASYHHAVKKIEAFVKENLDK